MENKLNLSNLRLITIGFVLLSVVLVLSSIFAVQGKVQAAGPKVITTAEELYNIRYDMKGNYVLGADIDLNVAPYNEGTGWDPIGDYWNDTFEGTFDGKGHTISGLMINKNQDRTGLFGDVSGKSKISNVNLVDVNITAGHNIGALLGHMGNGGLIENVTVTGKITGADVVGGIAGYLSNAKIKNSHANVTVYSRARAGGLVSSAGGDGALIEGSTSKGIVESNGSMVGGLAAEANFVKNSFSSAKVISTNAADYNNVGGLIGYVRPFSGEITNSFATGDVEAISNNVGGLIGYLSVNGTSVRVTNSYATGTVTGKNNVGGLVGNYFSSGGSYNNVLLKDSYATGNVNGENQVGGLIGTHNGEKAVFQKNYATGKVTANGDDAGGLIGKMMVQAKVQDAYARGVVIGVNNVGGLVGNNEASTIERAYATGNVNGNGNTGGIVGKDLNGKYSSVASNYYDSQSTGQFDSKGGTGLLTAVMTNIQNKESTYANWNFKSVWDMEPNNYPIFAAFTDTNNHWAKNEIKEAAEKGYFTGYPDGSFKPATPITRAEFAVILSRAIDLDGSGSAPAFTDANKIPAWAKEAIDEAYKAGIIKGDASGTFRPNDKIRRSEIAAMTARAFDLKRKGSGSTGFADDKNIPAWAKNDVAALKDHGIVQGKEGNNFAPLADTIRAEGAVILLRSLK